MSLIDTLFHDAHINARFIVLIDGIIFAVFKECTLPTLTMKPQTITEGGQNTYIHQLPGRIEVGTLRLKMGVSRTGELIRWYNQVLDSKISDARRSGIIIFLDQMSLPVAAYAFIGGYPIKYSGPALNGGESAVAMEEIELAIQEFYPVSLASVMPF
jgi:phage tail-like protein